MKWSLSLAAGLVFLLICQLRPASARAATFAMEEPRENALVKVKAKGVFDPRTLTGGSDGVVVAAKRRASPSLGVVNKQWLELEGIPPARVSVRLHSDATLECQAVGSPPPMIYWLKNGKPIDSAVTSMTEETNQVDKDEGGLPVSSGKSGFVMAKVKSKLPLRCIRPEDEAQYTCIADNDGRQLVASTLVVIEEDDPSDEVRPECELKLSLFQHNKKAKQGVPAYILSSETLHMESIGSDVLLPCRGAGRPRPHITWVDAEGQRVANGKKYQVNADGYLLIRSLSWGDMGEYSCLAENQHGSDLASTFLYPLQTEDS